MMLTPKQGAKLIDFGGWEMPVQYAGILEEHRADMVWVKNLAEGYDVQVENISVQTAQLAVLGPRAMKTLQSITDIDLSKLKYYWFTSGKVADLDCLVSRTGYTGEDGFELYHDPQFSPKLWDEVLKAGSPDGIQPIGLGARDTLRFEACLPLYGNELGQNISPLKLVLVYLLSWIRPISSARKYWRPKRLWE